MSQSDEKKWSFWDAVLNTNPAWNEPDDDFYEADKPLTRVQSALEVQAACSDDFNYLSLEDSLNFGKGYPDE